MFRKSAIGMGLLLIFIMTGCASVPMASKEQDVALKEFPRPTEGKAAIYVYRNSFVGQALKKDIYLDGIFLGESANKVYFHKEIVPGKHELSTESEFSNNTLNFDAEAGRNYFAEQYIKMGAFVGGANVQMVSDEEGMKNVRECSLAITPLVQNQ